MMADRETAYAKDAIEVILRIRIFEIRFSFFKGKRGGENGKDSRSLWRRAIGCCERRNSHPTYGDRYDAWGLLRHQHIDVRGSDGG